MSWSLLHMCHKGRKLECAHIPCEVSLHSLQFKLLIKAWVEFFPLFGILGGIDLHMTQCKIEFTYASLCQQKSDASQDAEKVFLKQLKLSAGTRALRICMICYRPKLTVWLEKLILSTKKHLKSWTTFWKGRLWRVLEAKPMTPGQLLGPPEKFGV